MGIQGGFTRWQSITITQLGYAINLILSLATGSLGFSLSLTSREALATSCPARRFLLLTVAALLTSVGLGIWCVLNRLHDFRETERIARDKERGNLTEREHNRRKAEADKLGELTWFLFRLQMALFSSGVVTLVVTFALLYHSSLW
jgi:hypothetical protein